MFWLAVISESFPAAGLPRRRTAPCRVEGTENERWAESADWSSAASPCAGRTANATLPSSGTAAGKTRMFSHPPPLAAGTRLHGSVFPALHWPWPSGPLGCLFEECVWGPVPLFFVPAAPCLGPPNMVDLDTQAIKETALQVDRSNHRLQLLL